MPLKIVLMLSPGLPLLPVGLARAVLDAAARHAPDGTLQVRCLSVTGGPVETACGTILHPDVPGWPDCGGSDLLLLFADARHPPHLPMGLRGAAMRVRRDGGAIAGVGGGAGVVRALGGADTGSRAGTQAFSDCEGDPLAVTGALLTWLAHALSPGIAADTAAALDAAPRGRGGPVPGGMSQDAVIARMQRLMAETVGDPWQLGRIAERLGLSPKQLRLRCRKVLGVTPGKVYRDIRLAAAREAVEATALPVHAVAKAAGFASPSSFTRRFRDIYGKPPRGLRPVRAPAPGAAPRKGAAASSPVP